MKKLLVLFVLLALPYAISAQVSVNITTTNVNCNGGNNGSATATPIGGTPPYTYLWSPSGGTTASATGLSAGTYTVLVTDNSAGTATATCVITQPTPITITVMPFAPLTICAGSNVSYSVSGSGGVAPYTYSWVFQGGNPASSNMPNQIVSYSSAGMFNSFLTVTDANGCVASATITLTVAASPTITVTEIPATCNLSNASMSSSGAMTYSWVPGNLTGATVNSLTPGITYTCTGTDMNGCTAQVATLCTDSCDYVWPGDANDDAIADNIDILDIGIANGATGTARANATINWIGQPSVAWGTTLASGTDYKWVDCDGNGTINPIDTQAVVLNYGMTHTNRVIAPTFSSVGPDISFVLWQDTMMANGNNQLAIFLGSASNPATNVYGFAFRLNYDATEISTPSFGLVGGSTWFGTPGNDLMRVVLHPNAAMGYVDVAITRLDQMDVSGQGAIGSLYFTSTSNQVGSGNFQPVAFTITNVVLASSTGAQLPVNSVIGDTVEVCDPPLIMSMPNSTAQAISVYPNPANEVIHLQIPAGAPQVVTLEDISGRIVYSHSHSAGLNTIPVADFPAGMYVLRTSDVNGNSSMQKITITR